MHTYVVNELMDMRKLQMAADGLLHIPPKSQICIVWRCMSCMLIDGSDFLLGGGWKVKHIPTRFNIGRSIKTTAMQLSQNNRCIRSLMCNDAEV